MVFYFSGEQLEPYITEEIRKSGNLIYKNKTGSSINVLRYVKQNITHFSFVNIVIMDLSAVEDSKEELLCALKLLKTMYEKLRFIILAPGFLEEDSFVVKCFALGIYDMICSLDLEEIITELQENLMRSRLVETSKGLEEKGKKGQKKINIKSYKKSKRGRTGITDFLKRLVFSWLALASVVVVAVFFIYRIG